VKCTRVVSIIISLNIVRHLVLLYRGGIKPKIWQFSILRMPTCLCCVVGVPVSFLESSFLTAQACRNERLSRVHVTGSVLIGFKNNKNERKKNTSISIEPRVYRQICAIQPEVQYFWTSSQIFPVSFVSRPLVKGNEDSGYEVVGILSTVMPVLVLFMS